jgi:hypothetical protein
MDTQSQTGSKPVIFLEAVQKEEKTALIDQINWIFRKTKKIGG